MTKYCFLEIYLFVAIIKESSSPKNLSKENTEEKVQRKQTEELHR